MYTKWKLLLGLVMIFSMILSACGPADLVEPVAPQAPVLTEAPVVEVAAPDVQALFTGLIDELPADKGYGTVKPAALNEELVDRPPFLLDVRETAEIEAEGYIEGAVNIPVRELLANLDKLPATDEPIVVYCASGHRGGMTLATLQLLGYTNVRNLAGGLNGWKKASLPVVTGSAPVAPVALGTPEIKDQPLFEMLDGFFVAMPDDFYAVKSDKLAEALTGATPPTIIDIRTADEFAKDGYIEGAINIPMQEIFSSLDKLPVKDTPIVVHCVSGHRGSIVVMGLRMLGYENVTNLAGGLNAWKAAKLPVAGWVDWATVMGDFITNLPEGFYSTSADKLNAGLADGPVFIVDVRETSEVEQTGHIAGSINIPIRDLLKNLDKLPALDQKIVITCASGHRGAIGMMALRLLGYTDVVNLGGGIGAWTKANFPLEAGLPAEAVVLGAPEVDATRLAGLDAYLSALPEGFSTIKAPDLNTEIASGTVPFLLDVRTEEEKTNDGYIEGSVLMPVSTLPAALAQLPADKAAPIVVICKSGHRGGMAMMYLNFLGYTNVRNLGGGMNAWIAAELPVVK